jgi:hypothetical protein
MGNLGVPFREAGNCGGRERKKTTRKSMHVFSFFPTGFTQSISQSVSQSVSHSRQLWFRSLF